MDFIADSVFFVRQDEFFMVESYAHYYAKYYIIVKFMVTFIDSPMNTGK